MVNINPSLLLNQATTKTALAYNATQTDAEVESTASSGPDAKADVTMRKAVWIGDNVNHADLRLQDVWILQDGTMMRYESDANGNGVWQKTDKIYRNDFEKDRGDVRAQ